MLKMWLEAASEDAVMEGMVGRWSAWIEAVGDERALRMEAVGDDRALKMETMREDRALKM